MTTRWFQRGTTGWVLLGAAILAWDLAAPDQHTLSETFRRAHADPVKAIVQAAAVAVVTAHLYNKIPKAADPLHLIHIARDSWRDSHGALAA